MIIVKLYSEAGYSWQVYHRSLANTERIELDGSGAKTTGATTYWNSTTANDSVFSIGTHDQVNKNGASFVAYLFAHNNNDGGYGSDADQDIIKCGTYQSDGAASEISVDLGFEAQFVMVKAATTTGNWHVQDTMRGMAELPESNNPYLQWNTSDAASADGTAGGIVPTANGFRVGLLGDINIFNATQTYIYMAIRRGPMATPTAASSVFHTSGYTSNSNSNIFVTGFNVDMNIATVKTSGSNRYIGARLTGSRLLDTATNAAQADLGDTPLWDGASNSIDLSTSYWGTNSSTISYSWGRAPGYFDVVAYTGDGTGTRTVAHNLGVVPEMMWLKKRSTTSAWYVYHKDLSDPNNGYIELDKDAVRSGSSGAWGTGPTSTNFQGVFNTSSQTHVVYLFATLAGVSKVGSVSHSGSSTDVDCGFSSGSAFVLLKRTDASGGWYVWDSARGVVSGNDPYIFLDDNAAEVTNTDLIDPLSSGFTITDDFTDGTYIFYAIAGGGGGGGGATPFDIEILLIGGGGSGGKAGANDYQAGGGGGGGVILSGTYSYQNNQLDIVVGGGGAGITGTGRSIGNAGSVSSVQVNGAGSTYISLARGGGAGGAGNNSAASEVGGDGANGGGGYASGGVDDPGMGYGVNGTEVAGYHGDGTGGNFGGGGGGGAGGNASGGTGGAGTNTHSAWATATSTGDSGYYGGGGAGSYYNNSNTLSGGAGGGGDGAFSSGDVWTGQAGAANTGGGGAAGGGRTGSGAAGAGGSGLVIIRYSGSAKNSDGNSVVTTGGYTYHVYTSNGTFQAS